MTKHRLLRLMSATASAVLIAGIAPSYANNTFDRADQSVYFGQVNIDADGSPERASSAMTLSSQDYDRTLTALIAAQPGVAGRSGEILAGTEGTAGNTAWSESAAFQPMPDRATDADH